MNRATRASAFATRFDRDDCAIGVVHIGFGAFHRAHQAVYLDDYMEATGDLRWGIAAVNLRGADTAHFDTAKADIAANDGYYLQSFSADGHVALRRVRSHVHFADWSVDAAAAEAEIARASVHFVTMTVTESGYYTDPTGRLAEDDPVIAAEIAGGAPSSVYGYLRAGLRARIAAGGAPITIACCDNIRSNGKMLGRNLSDYLRACGDTQTAEWIAQNAVFPCSMVDRITPRSPDGLGDEIAAIVGRPVASPVMAEDFMQWVLQDSAAAAMPELSRADVIVTADVDPYEETKIRVLNGGHTALAYLAALEGIETFDAAMRVPHLADHFDAFEMQDVLPALTLDLPFSKSDYVADIRRRFGNRAIGDTVARICADGMAKFPIFIRPTLEGCFAQGRVPRATIHSIAGWFVFARHVAAGKIPFKYVEPGWDDLAAMLTGDAFVTSTQLWGDVPTRFPEFADLLRHEISELESKWPV